MHLSTTITVSIIFLLSSALGEHVDLEDFLLPPRTPTRYRGAGNCTDPCNEDLEFCGTDHSCHVFSCATWFAWGPPEFTGHVLGVPVQIFLNRSMVLSDDTNDHSVPMLECEDVSESVHSPSVIYGCSGWICVGDLCEGYGESVDPKEGLAQDFRQRCTAKFLDLEFVCYDNNMDILDDSGITAQMRSNAASENDDVWDSFLMAVDHGNVNCSNEWTLAPEFIYTVYLISPFQGITTGSSTLAFNETHAAATIYSSLELTEQDGDKSSSRSDNQPLLFLLSGMIGLASVLTW